MAKVNSLFVHHEGGCKKVERTSDEELAVAIRALYVKPSEYDFKAVEFPGQIASLITRYTDLVKEISSFLRPNSEMIDSIDKFKNELLQEDVNSKFYVYRLTNNTQYFKSVKKLLEEILCLLNHKKEKSKDEVRSYLQSLITGLHVCAPGLLGHLEELKIRLTSENSVLYWLGELRTRLVETYADIHVSRNQIPDGNHVHVWMAFIKHANEMGYHLVKATHSDMFELVAGVGYFDYLALREYLKTEYCPKSVVHCVEANVRGQINDFVKKYQPQEKSAKKNTGYFWQTIDLVSQYFWKQEQEQLDLTQWLTISEYASVKRDALAILKSISPNTSNVEDLEMTDLLELSEESDMVRIKPKVANNLKKFVRKKLVEQNILTENSNDDLFARGRKMPPNPLAAFFRSWASFFQENKLAMVVGAIVGTVSFVRELSLLPSIIIGSIYFTGVRYLNHLREYHKQKGYEHYRVRFATQDEKQAFQEGVAAQKSYYSQAATLFKWQAYQHANAYYAGVRAEELINDPAALQLKDRMRLN